MKYLTFFRKNVYYLLFFISALGGCFSVNSTSCKGRLRPRVVFLLSDGREITVDVELACTDLERARGLMYRKELPPNRGMLFIFPYLDYHSFWMKNTYIPLDIIHIDGNYRVVGIIENARPLTTNSLVIDKPSLYVLEVNAFFARDNGISPGTKVKLIDINCP